jgi:hypothetical protein
MQLTVNIPEEMTAAFKLALNFNGEEADAVIVRCVRAYTADTLAQLSRQFKIENTPRKSSDAVALESVPRNTPQIDTHPTKPVVWNGQSIDTWKREYESFQDFVKRTLRYFVENDLIPPEEMERLQTKEYSKQALGLEHALFVTNWDDVIISGHARYWTKWKLGDKYYVCSQWWKQNLDIYQPRFAKWIEYVIGLNNTDTGE